MTTDLNKNNIKVIIIGSTLSFIESIKRILEKDKDIVLLAELSLPRDIISSLVEHKPDVIIIDDLMSVHDDYLIIKKIMAYRPVPILAVPYSNSKIDKTKLINAISYGVIDIVTNDEATMLSNQKLIPAFLKLIKDSSKVKVIRHPLARIEEQDKLFHYHQINSTTYKIIAIVTSTGGPKELASIFEELPTHLRCPVVVVQHISESFLKELVSWLQSKCKIKVKLAEDNEKLMGGVIYFAPANFNMIIAEDMSIKLISIVDENNNKPGNILLHSVAKVYGEKAIGVILTGMGEDGASGIKAIKEKGGLTIAQDEETSVVFGMPKAAIEMGVIDFVLPGKKIAEIIIKQLCK
ncbi:MAG: chemotaxis protein CheB [Pseudomonadota bacterium]